MPPLHWLLLSLRIIVIKPGFVHCHQSRQEIIWIAPKKFQNLLRRLVPLKFLIRVQAFRVPLRGDLLHVQIFMNDGPNPLTWDAQLLSYWFSRNQASYKISAWIWSVIFGVFTVLGRPGWGAAQVEKSPHLNKATQFLMVAYDGACSRNVSVRMAWISSGALPCIKKTWWQPASRCFEIARVAWHISFQPL